MAKRRVFELARELNMTNKELLDELQKINVDVSSHLSSLEDDTVNRIKNEIFGREKKAEVEDTRIKPNVIRRRRKAAPEARTGAAEEARQTEKPAPETPAEPEAAQEPSEAAAPETEGEAAEEKTAEAGPSRGRQAEAEEPAGKPEPSAEPSKEEIKATEPDQKAAVKETAEPDKKAEKEQEKQQLSEPAEKAAEPEEKPAETEKKKTGSKKEAAKKEKPAAEEEKKTEAPKKAKKKKGKKGAPARIISMPEAEERPLDLKAPETTEEAPTVEEPETKSPAPEPKPQEAEPEKPRGKKKKQAESTPLPDQEPEKAKKPGRKKTGFKRKEVIEGDALQDNRFGRGKKGKKKGKPAKPAAEQSPQITTPKAIKRRIKIDDTVVLSDLAKRMGVKGNELIKRLMEMGMMVTLNQSVDFETAELLASEYNFEVEKASFEEEAIIQSEQDSPEQLEARPPVVTIMGHVDHGKTSLLDVIRHSKITEKEAGGITQHIGAYRVPYENGDIIFLDTPGHEAFTAMRARGAKVTDLVILVVAADDGVMPQTAEAIDHSRAAGVPIIVAINKIDKSGAQQDRIKRELAEKGLVPEEWGGDTICVPVSAKQETGLDELLEMVLLQAEVLELKANPNKPARGYIIESKLETGRGPVATVLIHEGTLHTGEPVVSGIYYGKIRAMFDDLGKSVREARPSYPVEIIGLTGVPMAGDELVAVADEKDAKQVSEHRQEKQRSRDLTKTTRMSLESLYEKMKEGEIKDLNLIIKADVQGSIEALKDSLTRLSTDEVRINVVHSATGTIHESDISLAAVSNAIILGFNVRPAGKVAHLAEEENVDIKYYNVIYNAIKDIKDAMVGLMESHYEERVLGRAEIRQVFSVPSMGAVAGCMVLEGKIQRGQPIRVIREGIVIHEGKIASLKRYKDDVREVTHNYECGIGVEKFNDIKIGDIIECYWLEEIKPVIE
ncbi:MAG: translation initiation factor IF-2 [Desulfobacterales bacterium]|nr:translation initiation factor IF-2 [Desulfobacterales bacterium]